jgi:hypothetical protein
MTSAPAKIVAPMANGATFGATRALLTTPMITMPRIAV